MTQAGAYEFVVGDERLQLEQFAALHSTGLVKIMAELNAGLPMLQEEHLIMLKIGVRYFELINQPQICLMLRDESLMREWFMIFFTIIRTPGEPVPADKGDVWEQKMNLDKLTRWKIRKIIFRSLTRFTHHCNVPNSNNEIKAIAKIFSEQVIPLLLDTTSTLLTTIPISQISMKTHCFIVRFLTKVLASPQNSKFLLGGNIEFLVKELCSNCLPPASCINDESYLLHLTKSIALDSDTYKLISITASFLTDVFKHNQHVVFDDYDHAVWLIFLVIGSLEGSETCPDPIENYFIRHIIPSLLIPQTLTAFQIHLAILALVRYMPYLQASTTESFFSQSTSDKPSAFMSMLNTILMMHKGCRVMVYLSLDLTSAALLNYRLDKLTENASLSLMTAVMSDSLLSSLPIAIAQLQDIVSANKDVMQESAPKVIEALLAKWNQLEKGAGEEIDDVKLRQEELEIGKETCLETIHNILRQVQLSGDKYEVIAQVFAELAKKCIIDKDEECFHRVLQILSVILCKSGVCFISIAKVFPIICYTFNGWPQHSLSEISQADKSLVTALDWWKSSEQRIEPAVAFFTSFLQQSGAAFSDTNDPFGTGYLKLLAMAAFATAKRGIQTSHNWEISSAFRVLTAVLEFLPGLSEQDLSIEAEAVKELVTLGGDSKVIRLMALRYVCTYISTQIETFAKSYASQDYFKDLLGLLLNSGDLLKNGGRKDRKLLFGTTVSLLLSKDIEFDPQNYSKLIRYCLQTINADADDDDWNEEGIFDEAPDIDEDAAGEVDVGQFWDIADDCDEDMSDKSKPYSELERKDEVVALREALYYLKNHDQALLVARTSGLSLEERSTLQTTLESYKPKTDRKSVV